MSRHHGTTGPAGRAPSGFGGTSNQQSSSTTSTTATHAQLGASPATKQGGQSPQPHGQTVAQTAAQPPRPPRTKSMNLDIAYDGPQSTAGVVPPPGGQSSHNTVVNHAKATAPAATRPPIQRTPQGNFPQAPVGVGATPHMSHSTEQATSSSTSSTHSQVAPLAGTGDRTVATGTTVQRVSRPPIGQSSTVNTSQESHSTSLGRNSTPQGAITSDGRNAIFQSPQTKAQASPPSPGRNGTTAPQRPLSHAQTTDRRTDLAPSPGRNRTPQGAPPSPSRNPSPKRPPIGHNRKPPNGG